MCVANLTSHPYILIVGAEVGQASMVQVVDVLRKLGSNHQPSDYLDSMPDPSHDGGNYAHLQPVIDSLPNELSMEEHDAAV